MLEQLVLVAGDVLQANRAQPLERRTEAGNRVTGTYNAKTHAFVMTWTSLISGGPFNGFTGYWHLTGKVS